MTVALVANIARPISSAISTAFAMDNYGKLNDYGKLGAWSPLSLFAASEVGAWYDPSDLTTMFQDRAGTTPVTADGQTVGKILDKSGRGNHATAPSDAARPLYKTDGTYHWLQFDGVDDSLSTAAIDFTSTDKMSVFSGIRKASDATQTVPISFGNISTTPGTFEIDAPNVSTTQSYAAYFRGTGSYSYWYTLGFPALNKNVIAVICDLSVTTGFGKDKVNLRINTNDINETWSTSDAGTGSFSSSSLMLGARGLSPVLLFNGNIYSIIVRGALSTTQEITDTETWVNQRTGAY